MSYTDRAIKALQAAEQELRSIITEAASAQAYRDVASIANVADGLATLLRQVAPDLIVQTDAGEERSSLKLFGSEWPESVRATAAEHADAILQRHGRSPKLRRDQYPQFFREGDRLVKVAWSKKERQPYEHRAPREVIDALVQRIQLRYKHVGDGRVFEAAQVMPLRLPNSTEEYPSYQAYMALAWLRHVGVVTRKGREGYVMKKAEATTEKLGALWNAMSSTIE